MLTDGFDTHAHMYGTVQAVDAPPWSQSQGDFSDYAFAVALMCLVPAGGWAQPLLDLRHGCALQV